MTSVNHTEQANQVLALMNVKFECKFIKHDFHFSDDKETRDIFSVSFHRNGKAFFVRFGQSINDSTGDGNNPPTAYDVLSCIQKYEVGTFDNFCSDFGYNTDSRRAEKTYKAVVKEWNKVSNFFTEEEIEKLQEIQ